MAEDLYHQLLQRNRDWVQRRLRKDPDYFTKLAAGQNPQVLWIGCADSRVPENRIIDTQPGDVFVHRNIANVVVHTDTNLLSVLDYAVNALAVKHIIVCGHYGCGGVQAAMAREPVGLLDNWLRHIQDVYDRYQEELEAIADEKQRVNRLVELNVVEQTHSVALTSIVQRAWHRKMQLAVHGWVFDMHSGRIIDTNCTFNGLGQVRRAYRMKFS